MLFIRIFRNLICPVIKFKIITKSICQIQNIRGTICFSSTKTSTRYSGCKRIPLISSFPIIICITKCPILGNSSMIRAPKQSVNIGITCNGRKIRTYYLRQSISIFSKESVTCKVFFKWPKRTICHIVSCVFVSIGTQ